MKHLILPVLFALTSISIFAQSPLSFQAKAGIGTANFYGRKTKSDTRIAYKAGVGINYEFNKTWMLQPSINFVSIGASKDILYVGKVNMNEIYIQLPIMMSARLNLGNNYTASLSAGPYVAYGVGGMTSYRTEEYTPDSGMSDSNLKFRIYTFGNRAEKNMGNKRFDAGLMFGINLEYKRVIFGAELQVGMVNVNNQLGDVLQQISHESISPKNLASFFTMGYRF